MICHDNPVTSQGDFAFCCTVTLAESKNKVDKMVNVLKALMNEESHKECLQRHRQTDNPSSCRNIIEKEDKGKCLNLLNWKKACKENRHGNLRMNNISNAVIINYPPERPKICSRSSMCII